jgi:hypothetical protein
MLSSFILLILLSSYAYSDFEDLHTKGYYSDSVVIKDEILRYNTTTNLIVRLEDGLPIYGTIHNKKESKKIDYNYESSKNKAAAYVHPQVDYKNNLIRAYSFPFKSFAIKLLDAMTGKIVLDKKGGADKEIDGKFVFGKTEDSGTIFDYSHLPDGIYFLLLYNDKNEIYFSEIIEKPKQ